MKLRHSVSKRLLAMLLSIALMLTYLPNAAFLATAAGADSRVADPSTMNDWQHVFLDPHTNGVDLTTENAGLVWTDKSVFPANAIPAELTNAVSAENAHVSVQDTGDNFLVALSAIASNKEIVGYSTVPTDTVFVLDLSSSMRSNDDNNGSAIDELVAATNQAISDLLALNKNNRIAVVLYAGNTSGQFNDNPGATRVILPLDTYSANGGAFLESTRDSSNNRDYAVKVAANVRNSAGGTVAETKMDTARGTFMQDGIYEAMRVFLGVEDTTVAGGIQAGTKRLPIMVLMTDGEPTMANNDYNGNDTRTDLGNSNIYLRFNNQDYNHRDTIAFLTQLTAAFAKREVTQHYEKEALLYTLAFGEEVNTLEEALSVMDPARTSATLNGFWNDFLAGQAVRVFTTQTSTRPARYEYLNVTNDAAEPLTAADKLYVEEFFPAETVAELNKAFQAIVDEIVIQSKYYPTYVERDHDHDGYITFTDKIGAYMDVKTMNGFVVGNHYFSGQTLAKGFEPGSNIFGTIQNPNAYGNALVASVKQRLGIESTAVAQSLLQNAYDHGQLSYKNEGGVITFSNYIGWYSDADGNYLDFWYEGADVSQAPAGATHAVKSYGFLGETDQVHGISDTDMLYASVRVSKELVDYDGDGIVGETMLLWQIPASLIPTLTYQVEVTVDSQGNITGVESVELENDQVKPIRLLYEIGLQAGIHDWNVAEKVNAGYVSSTANKDAGYVFYTNQWKKGGTAAEATSTDRNTYSHYEPSLENERYYYTENTPICTDQNGTVYTGSAKPSANGTYYRAFRVFEKMSNGTYRMHTHYEQMSSNSLEDAVQVNGQWVVPKGEIHRYLDNFIIDKSANDTATLGYTLYPNVVSGTDTYYAYSTLGNNGKLVYTPATGIKVTKTLQEAVAGASDTFTFTLSGGTGAVTLIRLDETGDEASRQTLTFQNGQAEFVLKAGETVYIVELTPGTVYTLTERSGETYKLVEVKLNGQSAQAAVFTAQDQTIQTAEFVNGPRGYGDLYIAKEIVSDHDIPGSILAETFEVTVFVGTDLAGETFKVRHIDSTGNAQEVNGVVDAAGYLKVNGSDLVISADVTWQIVGLPEGTQVTIAEILSGTQSYYTATIKTRDHTGAGQDNDGTVTIYANSNATAVITNTYTPKPATVSLDISGEKRFDIEAALTQDVTFEFLLQKWDGAAWQTIKTTSVTYPAGTAAGNGVQKSFAVEALKDVIFDKVGDFAYQIVEKIPENRPEHVIYDRTTYTFTVHVTDEGGYLVATIKDFAGNTVNGTYNVAFHNTHHVAPVSVDIQKAVTDTTDNPAITPAGFTYTATKADANWVPSTDPADTTTQVTDGAGQIRFAYNLRTTGEYRFIVKETIPAGATLVTDGAYAGKYQYNGWYYDATVYYVLITVTQAASGDMTAVVQIATDPNGTFTGTANSTTLNFTNIYDPQDGTVDLDVVPTVLKQLEGRPLKAGEFTFYVVADGADWNDPANILATGTNDASGNVYFDKVLTFNKIGEYKFDIVEKPGNLGGVIYDTTVYDLVVEVTDNGDGTLKATYFFEDAVSNQVTFHNTYNLADTQWSLEGTKALSGRPMLNAEFRFVMVRVTDESGKTVVAGAEPIYAENLPDTNGDGIADFAFPAITYTAEDAGKTYYYLVTEYHGGETILGVIYDDASFVVKVEITDDGDGNLTASETILNAGAVHFENTYASAPAELELAGVKVLEGKPIADYTFSFRMTKTDSSYQPLSGATPEIVTNDAHGVFKFAKLTYTAVGDHYYLIEEVIGAAGGITYDTAKYRVHVKVSDDGQGNLLATATIVKVVEDMELDVTSVVFQNTYEVTEGAKLQLKGVKTLDVKRGELKLTDDLFTFVIKEGDAEIGRVTNKGAAITFPELSFTPEQVGKTFTYTIEEVNTGMAGVTYSQEKYTLTVTVGEKDGKVTLDYTLTDSKGNPVELTAVSFTNSYEAKPAQAVIEGTKEMTGRNLADGEYSFQLFDAAGKLLQTVKNVGKGFRFDAITYTSAGTYTYTVREVIPENAKNGTYKGVTYDAKVYTVTVTVTDEGGQLKATVSHNAQQLVFHNSYAAEQVSVDLLIIKTLKINSGDGVGLDSFKFQLVDAEGNVVGTFTSGKDGKVAGVLNYTDADEGKTFTYTLSELNTQVKGVTYSTAKYTLEVTVSRNAEGKLIATAKVDGKATDKVEFSFVNTFDAAETPNTGDSFRPGLILMVMAACATGLVVLLLKKKELLA